MTECKSDYRKKLRELNEAKSQIEAIESELKKLYKKTIEFDMELKYQEEIEALQEKTTGLNIELVRDFLCKDKDAAFIKLKGYDIGIQGDGPWGVIEFQDFLLEKDFSVANITDPKIQYIVLGERNVDEEELDELITNSIELGIDLYIYTQELFLAWLITGENPLETLSEEELLKSAKDHWSLQYLINSTEFPWPQLIDHSMMNKSYDIKTFEWNGALSEESPLWKIGYTVRKDSLSTQERRELLKRAYTTASLDKFLLNKEDRDRWGDANSPQRLYTISSLIAWLANFQGSTKPEAREKWQSDLNWLKQNYYDSKMKFWPARAG